VSRASTELASMSLSSYGLVGGGYGDDYPDLPPAGVCVFASLSLSPSLPPSLPLSLPPSLCHSGAMGTITLIFLQLVLYEYNIKNSTKP
jgi:hypothetical protein